MEGASSLSFPSCKHAVPVDYRHIHQNNTGITPTTIKYGRTACITRGTSTPQPSLILRMESILHRSQRSTSRNGDKASYRLLMSHRVEISVTYDTISSSGIRSRLLGTPC